MLQKEHQKNVELLLAKIEEADAILAGAAAGMSAACGYNFFYQNDEYFQKYFQEFHEKYGFIGAFNGYYHPYKTPEERWAFIARLIFLEYECETGKAYYDLFSLIQNKKYHVLTTNQDFQFTGIIPEEKISDIQGDRLMDMPEGKVFPKKSLKSMSVYYTIKGQRVYCSTYLKEEV